MTQAERQARRRKLLRDAEMHPIYVRGENGVFDERIRIAKAVKNLSERQLIPNDVLQLILNEAVECIPPVNFVEKKFLVKMMSEFLNINPERSQQ